MKKRFVCRKMLKMGFYCAVADVIANFLLTMLLIILDKNINIVVSIAIPCSMALILLVLIFFSMIPYFGRISYEDGVIILWKFKNKYEIKSNKRVVFIFRNPWRPRFTNRSIYPMKIRVKGEKEIIPIQIIDKEVIEFLRQNLDYVVEPADFDFNRI